jgi:oligopeptide/dipeptide ABC transporter ATP-binding protein
MSSALLEVRDLRKHFVEGGLLARGRTTVRAVDGVSFSVAAGETLGLVGESGCGTSTLARALLFLDPPTSGEIVFDGTRVTEADVRRLRGRAQIVFQDPYGSLDPRMTVGDTIREALRVSDVTGEPARERVRELLGLVGLSPAHAERYPHEFSGGQRQRIGIARALSVEPDLIVCDEPVSALDVSVQAQVLNLLQDLQQQLGLSYLFIAHDLSVIEHVSDQVAVMYLGRIVELGETSAVVRSPRHPYTRALLSAVPIPRPGGARRRVVLSGDIPDPANPPSGCPFHPRCQHPLKDADCARMVPPLAEKGPLHFAACIKEPAYLPA